MNSSNYLEGHTMTLERRIRWSGVTCLIAAVLIVAAQFAGLFLLTSTLPLSESIKTAPVVFYNILKLLGFILLLLGMVGLYTHQANAGGRLGLIGFLVAFLGTVLVTGDWWFEAFVVPWLAEVAPHVLEVTPSGTLIAGGVTGFALFAAGWVLFGAASFRARVFPRWGAVLLIVGGALGFQAGSPPFLIVLAVGVGWLGYWLQKHGEGIDAVTTGELLVKKYEH